MSVLRSRFVQAVVILVGAFLALRFGIRPPAPWSVIQIYMAVVFLAVLIFVSSDTDSWRSFVNPMRAALVDPSQRPVRIVLAVARSEEHTSELQSRSDLVCRLLLEKKKKFIKRLRNRSLSRSLQGS